MASKGWTLRRSPIAGSALAAASTIAATLTYGQWLIFTACSITAVMAYASIIRSYFKIRRNVAFVLDAVENQDFAFRYTTSTRNAPDAYVNAYLNRLIDILERLTDDIREKDRYYEVILNSADNGIIVIDEAGNALHCNRAAHKMLHTDVISKVSHLQRVHPSLPSLLTADPPPSSISLQLPTGNMSLSVARSRVTLHGKQVDIIALSDISRSLVTKELESWESLTRVLTHEIMNSLTPLISISDSLLSDPGAALPDYQRGLATVAATGKSLKRFVESYRTFANIPTPNPSPFYVKPFLAMMQEICSHQMSGSAVKVDVKCAPSDLMLYADEQLIALVVTNILKNAMQAVAEIPAPEIKIEARLMADESVKIEISNNGPVIPAEAARQIFLPFFTTKPNGSGIGLSIAKRIMAASGGSISLRTLPRTTFTLTFA